MKEDEQKEVQLQIDIDDNTAQGVYCNFAIVNHSDADFTVDFIYLQPMQPKAKVRSRIITTPKHAKKLLSTLADNIRKYEEHFGAIPEDGDPTGTQDIMH